MALDAGNSDYSVHLVVQRYRTCKLLLEDEDRWASIDSPGMLLYVSFAASATEASVHAAAETVLNLPVLTTGLWGDGSGTLSIGNIIHYHWDDPDDDPPRARAACSITIVPQANLICKVSFFSPPRCCTIVLFTDCDQIQSFV
jgi:hypothetical protein